MSTSLASLLTALVIPAMAALGGALAVYSGYDDAPGGVLLGLLLISGAVAVALRSARPRSTDQEVG